MYYSYTLMEEFRDNPYHAANHVADVVYQMLRKLDAAGHDPHGGTMTVKFEDDPGRGLVCSVEWRPNE